MSTPGATGPVSVVESVGGDDVAVGTLYPHRVRGRDSASFTYRPEHLADPRAHSIDPALPLSSGTFHTPAGRPTFGALADCAPDRWGRRLLVRQEAAEAREQGRSPRSLGEADFLLGVRDDLRQGALRFTVDGGSTFLADESRGVPALTDLPELLDLAARAESDSADLPDLRRLVRAGSSLGGARPKAHVRTPEGRLAIAKFPSADRDTWDVMAWEKVALDLARGAGVEVPDSRLLDLAGRRVLVVDRFDRTAVGARVGYTSAMTQLEAADGERGSYLDIALVVETTSGQATAELQQLWRRAVLAVLLSNTDDHLRNHGFLHLRGGVWRLSPAFDINPEPSEGPTFLSTSLDGTDRPSTVEAALAVADAFRLTSRQAEQVASEVAASVGRWRDVAAAHGLSRSAVEAMSPAFSALDDVP